MKRRADRRGDRRPLGRRVAACEKIKMKALGRMKSEHLREPVEHCFKSVTVAIAFLLAHKATRSWC